MDKPKRFIHWDSEAGSGSVAVGRIRYPLGLILSGYGVLIWGALILGVVGDNLLGWHGAGALVFAATLIPGAITFIMVLIVLGIKAGVRSFREANGLDKSDLVE